MHQVVHAEKGVVVGKNIIVKIASFWCSKRKLHHAPSPLRTFLIEISSSRNGMNYNIVEHISLLAKCIRNHKFRFSLRQVDKNRYCIVLGFCFTQESHVILQDCLLSMLFTALGIKIRIEGVDLHDKSSAAHMFARALRHATNSATNNTHR